MITSYVRGHRVFFDPESGWYYMDGTSIGVARPCAHCGKLPTPEGHDACLGTIPGVVWACCGHGVAPGRVGYEDGSWGPLR